MRKLFMLGLCLIMFYTQGQMIQVVPGYQNTPITYGVTLRTKIINEGLDAAMFYAQYHEAGKEMMLLTESLFLQSFSDQVTGIDPLIRLVQLLKAIADFNKSKNFRNNLLIFTEWSPILGVGGDMNIFAKKAALLGILSQYHRQCGDYSMSAIQILHRTPGVQVPFANLKQVNHPGHATVEVIHNTDSIHFDMDPGMIGFMQTDSSSSSGYASITKLVADPSRITDEYLFRDSLKLTQQTLAEYRTFFQGGVTSQPVVFTNRPDSIFGGIILCSGCSIEWNYNFNGNALLIDTADAVQKIGFLKMFWYFYQMQSGSLQYRDSIYLLGQSVFNISPTKMDRLLQGKYPIIVYNSSLTADHFLELYDDTVATLKIQVPLSTRDVIIGRDLILPYLVTQVITSGQIIIGDTAITDSFSVTLWNNKADTADLESPWVPNNAINYLQSGIIPAGTSAEITVVFNPAFLNFFRDITLNDLGQEDTLHIISGSEVVTGFDNKMNRILTMHIHPNPVLSGQSVKIQLVSRTIKIFNLLGEILDYNTNSIENGYEIIFPDPGIFIISDGNMMQRVIVQ